MDTENAHVAAWVICISLCTVVLGTERREMSNNFTPILYLETKAGIDAKKPANMIQATIPQVLGEVCQYLCAKDFSLSHLMSDGRLNAAINEDEVISIIQEQFDISVPRHRAWYDFAIEDKSNFIPVNIKVTDTTHADNLNCKLGLYYALTGRKPSFQNEIGWLRFFEELHKNFGYDKTHDYYFLIVNKTDNNDIFCTTLKSLKTLQPNGNNLPFQSRWKDNRHIQSRSFEAAADMLLSTLGQSIKLRADIYFNFKKYFPEYV